MIMEENLELQPATDKGGHELADEVSTPNTNGRDTTCDFCSNLSVIFKTLYAMYAVKQLRKVS